MDLQDITSNMQRQCKVGPTYFKMHRRCNHSTVHLTIIVRVATDQELSEHLVEACRV